MLLGLFNRNKITATTDVSVLKERLDIYRHARPDPLAHKVVLIALQKYQSPGLRQIGRGFSFYTDPSLVVESQSRIPGSERHLIQASANVSFAEEMLQEGKRSFALTINQDSNSFYELRNRMIFGIYGTYEKDGMMEIETIFAPDMDDEGNITKMIKIPLSDEHVELALEYAENCMRVINNKENPNPQACLNRAMWSRHSALEQTGEEDMLRNIFGGQNPPVKVDFQEYRDFLSLDKNLTDDPKMHTIILSNLGEYSLRGSTHQGPAQSFYSDPNKKVVTDPKPVEFSGGHETYTETYHLSSSISCTEQPHGFGQRLFSMIMRKDSLRPQDIHDSMIFGIHGRVDKNGDLTVLKLMAPDIENGQITRIKEIPVTDETVHTAMLYAYECSRQIYEGEQIKPRQALEFAMTYQESEEGEYDNSPSP